MSLFLKIVIVLLWLAYLVSPADIVPEILIPYIGWLDDGLVLWSIYYLIRHGELPWFLFKRKMKPPPSNRFDPDADEPLSNSQARGNGPKKNSRPHQQQNGGTSGKTNGNVSENRQSRPRTAHEILGVATDASWEDIQKAYKQEIKKYHPDKVSHLGEEFSDLANEKFLEIQNAFDLLKAKRNGTGR